MGRQKRAKMADMGSVDGGRRAKDWTRGQGGWKSGGCFNVGGQKERLCSKLFLLEEVRNNGL